MVKTMKDFIKLESSAGIVLFVSAVIALIMDNSSYSGWYQAFLHVHVWQKDVHFIVNDGLMVVFFLLVGLEVKRELLIGELRTFNKAILPAIAAVGGMLVPAVCYMIVNAHHRSGWPGWAIPSATDIAFSLGILALLGKRVPPGIKVFLTALAIFDDVGAILIIAFFYTKGLSGGFLALALVCVVLMIWLNRRHVIWYSPYVFLTICLWYCLYRGGIHTTLAGIVMALVIPIREPGDPDRSPLRVLEHRLHPWVAFIILPLFAFSNAGMALKGMHFSDILEPVSLGIILGLFLGKQIGIVGSVWLAVRAQVAELPRQVSWSGLYGMSMIAGVGFTMSLFIGILAFQGASQNLMVDVRLGVLVGSLLSGLIGYCVLRCFSKKSP